ncbi:MAG: beta-ketoacyl-ACP synthase II [Anaerolineales bacterium]|nr:beta-ketoacyl-ACP synthase II [Anaerolineales bacterium]
MRKRVVITGLGCVSPLGNDVPTTWQNILQGKSGIGPVTHYDASAHKVRIAAEVKGFDPKELFGPRAARKMDRFTQFALAATRQAVDHANLQINDENRDRIGVIIGSGIGGVGTLYEQTRVILEAGPTRVSPFLIPMMLPDSAAGTVAIELGVRGSNMAVVTACATGTNALGESAAMIRRGEADVVFSGGSEAAVVPISMAGLAVMNAMSSRNDEPQRASRPFDKERDGFIMGEGAATLVLESLEHARARGATILAEVTGYGSTNDAYHVTQPAENGEGAVRCMRTALKDAGLTETDIDYINAHGTSTPLNDKSETRAIKTVFGERAYEFPVSSTKSMTGHLLGATGSLEAVFCTLALMDRILPPTTNYEFPDPDCDLDYVPNTARRVDRLEHVMSNSFGFGGHNATVIISRYHEEPGL